MTAKIIDGKRVAQNIKQKIKQEVSELKKQDKRPPGLAVILVGNDHASEVYVRNKRLSCEEVGFKSFSYDITQDISEQKLITLIEELNNNPEVDGILIQLPLPKQINENQIIERIHPDKDVDGFHPYNLGRLAQRRPFLRPCTPFGIIRLLEEIGINAVGKNAVIVGASNIVGRPMALEFLLKKATVTVCHRFTKDLASEVQRADILVAAIGQPNIIKTEWLKPGAVVIDVGINRTADGKLIGDIDFNTAKEKASYITPVPGGVGPMTIAMLLQNTLSAYQMRN